MQQAWHVWLLFPFSSSFFSLSIYPQRTTTWPGYFSQIQKTKKKTFWDWPSSAAAEQSEKDKYKEDRERSVTCSSMSFLKKISVWVTDLPSLYVFCFVVSLFVVDYVSLSLSHPPPARLTVSFNFLVLIFVDLFVCLSSSYWICLHAQNHLVISHTLIV